MEKRVLIPALVIYFSVIALLFMNNRPTAEDKITAFVEEHKSELDEIANSRLNGDVSTSSLYEATVDGVFTNAEGDSIVQFFYSGKGIAPASKYYGFYYSTSGKPAAFQNVDLSLEEDNGTWKWTEGGSDNGGMTKEIENGWYYYEAWF